MEQSSKWKLNYKDICKWATNSILFLAPLLLMYLGSVAAGINDRGFQWSDFYISNVVAGGMILYIINVATDFLKKLMSGNK